MGKITIEIEIYNQNHQAAVRLGCMTYDKIAKMKTNVIVDSGCGHQLILIQEDVNKLKINQIKRTTARLANGSIANGHIYEPVQLRLVLQHGDSEDHVIHRDCIVEPVAFEGGNKRLLGVIALEQMALDLDVTNQRLFPNSGSDIPLYDI